MCFSVTIKNYMPVVHMYMYTITVLSFSLR